MSSLVTQDMENIHKTSSTSLLTIFSFLCTRHSYCFAITVTDWLSPLSLKASSTRIQKWKPQLEENSRVFLSLKGNCKILLLHREKRTCSLWLHPALLALTNIPVVKQMVSLARLGVSLRIQLPLVPCVLASEAQPWTLRPRSWECCPGRGNNWQTRLPRRPEGGARLARRPWIVSAAPACVSSCTLPLAVLKTLAKTERWETSLQVWPECTSPSCALCALKIPRDNKWPEALEHLEWEGTWPLGVAQGMPDCHYYYGQIWTVTGKITFTQEFTQILVTFPPISIIYLLLENLTVQKKMKLLHRELGGRSSSFMYHSHWKPSELWRTNWGETKKFVLNLSWTERLTF